MSLLNFLQRHFSSHNPPPTYVSRSYQYGFTLISDPPDHLAVDLGSAYISAEFRAKDAAEGIKFKEAPIETPGLIGIVERYHAPLRAVYTKIRESLDKSEANDHDCLKMALYAVNSTVGPEGLVPMFLVFGALPRPARTTPAPTQLQRQRAIDEAKKAT